MSDERAELDAMEEVVPMNSPLRKPIQMSEAQCGHAGRVVERQSSLMWSKYVRGQQEHGGNCWEKPGMLAHAQDEVADLSVYLFTLDEQMTALAARLRIGAVTHAEAADEIERWLRK